VFFGTPAWAVPSLEALLVSDVDVVGVVTNPDRVAGRGLRSTDGPVKLAARRAGIEVLQPDKLRDGGFQGRLASLAPDIACVVAYGKILPPALLGVPRLGFVNAHFSLLPAYRGAAPVQWALINGDPITGISIMILSEGMDEGPVLAAEPMNILPSDSATTLGDRLAAVAGGLLVRTIKGYAQGVLVAKPQPVHGVSYAPKLRADDVRIDWSQSALMIRNLIRGANPEPGAWTTFRGKRMKVLEAEVVQERDPAPSGHLELGSGSLKVTCGDGALMIVTAQMQGKRPLSGSDLGRGMHLGEGDRLE
jgi:methionyl-tRNA formyltransferase